MKIRIGSTLACLLYLYGAGKEPGVAAQALPSPCLASNLTSENPLNKSLLFQNSVGLALDVAGDKGLNWTLPYQSKRSDSWHADSEKKSNGSMLLFDATKLIPTFSFDTCCLQSSCRGGM